MPAILQHHYVLAVHDVRRSAAFYVEMLGFTRVDEPPGWIFVARDGFMIMLGECPDDPPASALGCHSYFAYLRVDDASAFHRELTEKGAEVSALEDQPWGMREFGIKTPDGHRIRIGQHLAAPKRWRLVRQDDHGNEFEIERDLSFEEAGEKAKALETRGHKQAYWVREQA